MKTFNSRNFYGFMRLWLTKSSLFREIISSIIGLVAAALIFGVVGVYISNLMQENTTRFIFWTAIGSMIFKFFFTISTALAQEYERMKSLAIYDTLTGLYNRAYLSEAISLTFAHAKRTQEIFCVFVLDGNNIKDINDMHGHGVGDRAIRKIAQKIQEVVYRRDDIIIRLGGDEFVVICTSKNVEKMHARMIENLADKKIIISTDTHEELSLSVAVGMSYISTNEKNCRKKTPEEIYQILFVEADSKMYQHKEDTK